MDPLEDIIQELSASLEKTKLQPTSTSFQLLQMKLAELNGTLRELLQAVTENEMTAIINKLNNNEPLNSEEIDLIREWIIGDAISYLKIEKDFDNWLNVLNTLVSGLQNLYSSDITKENILELYGLNFKAIRLIPNILNYLLEKERIKSFELAVGDGIDLDEARIYRSMLIAKLESTKM